MTDLQPLQYLSLVLTAQCNQRCAYCYQNAKKDLAMTPEILKASLDLALNAGGEIVELAFLGGEPLLEFPMVRSAVEYAEEHCPEDKLVRFELTTNGLLLTEEVIGFCVEHDFKVKLSFDGVAQAQGFRAEGSSAVLERLLGGLRETYPDFYSRNVKIAMTLIPGAVPYLADSVQYFVDGGIRQIAISPVLGHCSGWRKGDIDKLDEQFSRIYETSLRHFQTTAEVPVLLLRRTGDEVQDVDGTMCGVADPRKLVVDVDGQVYGCPLFALSYQHLPRGLLSDTLEALRIGDLRDHEFTTRLARYPGAVRRAKIFNCKEDKYSSYGRCGQCEHVVACSICPVSIGHAPGNDDPNRIPDFHCAFSQVALKYRERFPEQPRLRERILNPPFVADEMERWRRLAEAGGGTASPE